MKNSIRGSLLLLLATVIWGFCFAAQSAGMDYIGPFTFQAIRCLLAVFALIPCIAVFDGPQIRFFFRRWADKTLWKAGILCGLALFFSAGFQQVGLVYTTAGKAGFITAMYIVFVPIVGIFRRKKPSANVLFSILLAIVGLYLLSYAGLGSIHFGDILMFCCPVAFAIQITIVDTYAAQVDCLRLNCIQSLVCSALSAVCMLFMETPNVGNILDCWLPLCYAGFLSMGAAYSLQILGQKRLEPTTASLIMSLESVFAALSGWIFLKETMNLQETLGCILMFLAVILSQLPFPLSKRQ